MCIRDRYNIANLIYSYTISLGDKKPYGDWSYDKALSIIHDAMQADNQPDVYKRQAWCWSVRSAVYLYSHHKQAVW